MSDEDLAGAGPFDVLLVEDNPDDADLVLVELHRAGLDVALRRVDTEGDYLAALDPEPDVILADYHLPAFDGMRALELRNARGLDVPFIIVSGAIGEDTAVAMMRQGAADYLLKDRLARLGPAVAKGVRDHRVAQDKERADRRFRALVEHSAEMLLVSDRRGIIEFASPACEHFFGVPHVEVVGTSGFDWVHPADLARVREELAGLLARPGKAIEIEVRSRHHFGTPRHCNATVTNLLDDPAVGGVVWNTRDVSDLVRYQAQLEHRALHDELTGLPNRALLLDRAGRALDRGASAGTQVALLLLDVDDLEQVNNALGVETGDAVLVEIARRLRRLAGPTVAIARLPGDEFAVLLERAESLSRLAYMCERVLGVCDAPCAVGGTDLFVTASVGIAVATPAHDRPESLLRDAHAALHRARLASGRRYEFFDDAMRAETTERLDVLNGLRRALPSGELTVHYQPVVRLDTGTVLGFEALVRWNHPERGLLAAKDFIAVAEESGLITSIGPWVLEQACEQGARWRTASGRHPGIGVNVSVRQLEDPAFADVVAGVLERTGLPPDHLVLEVTERVLVDCADRSAGAAAACPIAAALQTVRDLGVLVALDDFGTGYSSLAYLRQLPVDWIKIDRNFITGLDAASTDTSTDRGIVHAIVDLARGLGLQVLGEGIETQAERDALAGLGCKVGQGYFFGYPSPPAAWDGAVAAMP